MVDGLFHFAGNVIEVLKAPQRTLEELSRLSQLLDRARKAQEATEATAQRIEQELPLFQRVADWLRTAGFSPAVSLGLLLAAIPVVQSMVNSPHPVEQRIVIEQVINNYTTNLPSPSASPQKPFKAGPKPGRNEKCTCGSGKKWKHCCGSIQNPAH